jgi:hypothetical protein
MSSRQVQQLEWASEQQQREQQQQREEQQQREPSRPSSWNCH